MSSTRTTANGSVWRLWPTATPTAAARYQAISAVQLLDELTTMPPRVPLRVSAPIRGVSTISSAGGMAGIAGRPVSLYPDPWPAPGPRIAFHIEADGYLPLALEAELPPQPGFPETFTPHHFGTAHLHRQPTRVSGRALDAAGNPVAGATVSVTALWTRIETIDGPGDPLNGLSLATSVYADRSAGSTVSAHTLTILAGPKKLLEPAAAGDTRLKISNRLGVLPNQPLAIEPSDPERTEYIPASVIDMSSSADQSAWITLHHPLNRAHPAGVEVARTGFTAGPANLLSRPARRGDSTLLTGTLFGLVPGQPTLEISGGPAVAEYHGLLPWQTTTLPDGRFGLPPIHRVTQIAATASGGGQPTPTTSLINFAGEAALTADLVFS